jgi:protein TonB
MATRALLLCGDEKAVHAVTQILDELEICFEHSSEPPFALKRLAARRFELLIVDCDNVQNATQVFNSARASNLNKASIAIAIVEGKAGVPSAFRLGASLVLTKPVSLEQARNTLRTGIGMTRKEAQEVKVPVPAPVIPAVQSIPAVFSSTPAPVASAPVVPPLAPLPAVLTPVAPASAPSVTVAKAPVVPAPTAFAPIAPTPTPSVRKPSEETKPIVAEASASEKQAPAPRPPSHAPASTEEHKPALTNFTDEQSVPTPGTAALAKAAAAASGAAPAGTSKFDSMFAEPKASDPETKSKITASQAEPVAIAKETEEKKTLPLRIEDPLAEDDSVLDPIRDNGVPSFGTQSFAGLEGEKRKGRGTLVAGVMLLLVAAVGYAAWLTQPAFRDIAMYEYGEISSKIAALRGQPQTSATATPKPLPAPAPTASVPQPQPIPAFATEANTTSGAGPTTPSTNSNPAVATTSPSATSGPATITPQVTNAASASATQKGVSVQPAKQDTTPGHATPSPAVVVVNLPPSAGAGKSTASDLIEVPEDFADDQVVHRVHPVYPKQARAKKLHGTVVLQAVISKQGKVDSLQLVSGDPQLAQAAAEAVKQWRYKPYSRNGEPTDFQTRVTVDFSFPKSP